DELLTNIGEAGLRAAGINASEGAAGNISLYIGWPIEVRRRFPLAEPFALPAPAPALAGGLVIVTGSGRRLRDIHTHPDANLGVVAIDADGRGARLYTSPRRLFQRVTSEFNSHLAVHQDQVARSGTNFHALIHAQPPHLTYLSHIAVYRDQAYLNRQLLRWEPETIVNLPEGIGVLPYCLPGSPAMMEANLAGLREYRVVLWSKHGVMARSDQSVTRAADRIEYAETAALYEYMDLSNGRQAEGLTEDELREIVRAFGVQTTLI
ncbi:MAG: rhamnulose-1-phosphate aldolase, partial [Chloroflexales bacterium]|nr:rhamnulose-1-phosphate aldolase [Chloroflexales bacterium]